MNLRKAAELALEALQWEVGHTVHVYYSDKTKVAIDALRTALAEAEEPVAWYHPSGEGYDSAFRDHSTVVTCDGGDWSEWIPLYTHPPRRVPLTEEEVEALIDKQWSPDLSPSDLCRDVARAIERAHGIGGDAL